MLRVLCLSAPTSEFFDWAIRHQAQLILTTAEQIRPQTGLNLMFLETDPSWPVNRTINRALQIAKDDLAVVRTVEHLRGLTILQTHAVGLPRVAVIGPTYSAEHTDPHQTSYPPLIGAVLTYQAFNTIGLLDEKTTDLASVGFDYAQRARRKGMVCYEVGMPNIPNTPETVQSPTIERGWSADADERLLAPDTNPTNPRRWEGPCERRPWQYDCTVTLANLGSDIRLLRAVIESWRNQTVRPFISIYDTGTATSSIPELLRLEASDVEIHLCRWRGHQHPSQFVSLATEHGMADCRTPYLIFTHNDVFPITRTIVEELLDQTKPECPVVGYEMSPRRNPRWKGMVSHTLTCVHIPTMDRLRLTWNMRWLRNVLGVIEEEGWPDTEVPFNEGLRLAGLTPKLIGHDQNGKRQITAHFDHCRSYVSSGLYLPEYHEKAKEWVDDAIKRVETSN